MSLSLSPLPVQPSQDYTVPTQPATQSTDATIVDGSQLQNSQSLSHLSLPPQSLDRNPTLLSRLSSQATISQPSQDATVAPVEDNDTLRNRIEHLERQLAESRGEVGRLRAQIVQLQAPIQEQRVARASQDSAIGSQPF